MCLILLHLTVICLLLFHEVSQSHFNVANPLMQPEGTALTKTHWKIIIGKKRYFMQ